MSEELKSCPFCGSMAKIREHNNPPVLSCFNYFAEHYYSVKCLNIKCMCSFSGFASQEDAIKFWNTRTLTPAQEHAEELYEGLSTMLNITGDICEALTPLFYDLQGSLKDEPQRWQKLIEEIEAQEAQP